MTKANYTAYLDEYNKITILVCKSYHYGETAPFTLVDAKRQETIELKIEEKVDLGEQLKYSLSILGFIDVGHEYYVIDNQKNQALLVLGYISRTEPFDKKYYYGGDDLGVAYTREKTTFKIWTPTATHVGLMLLENDATTIHSLERQGLGVWSITINQDLEGMRYRYVITNDMIRREITDPYGRASTENGQYSVVVDFSKTIPLKTEHTPFLAQATDAIIYEVSVRDFTIHPSSLVKYPGKFLGLTELVYCESGFPRGLAYLKELGVTHIQLLPIFDFEGVDEVEPEAGYNWGYNPAQYNVPEGSYASDATNPYVRINELKTLINVLHEHGFGVIMDVVFNHVYDRQTFPFDAMVPTYFYRYDYQGMPSNGSGCGNDLATERRMVRKFVLDSMRFWLEEYGIDGFRFDLMGLIDVDTMNAARQMCCDIRPDTLLYGEGWDMNTALVRDQKAAKFNANKMPGIGHFNDTFRDTIKGHTFNHMDRGLALGSFSYANIGKQVLGGSSGLAVGETFKFFHPSQSINYVECHDNHTFWDRMKISNGDEGEIVCRKRQLLATAMVIFSQGVPFLHCGQEFFRTKKGEENSYKSPDSINAIDWGDVMTQKQGVDLVKGYIEIRKSHGAFRFSHSNLVKKHLRIFQHHNSVIEYTLKNVKNYGPYNEIRIFFNTQNQAYSLPIIEEGFYVIADAFCSGGKCIKAVGRELFLAPLSTTIIVKED
ncbi:MAG: type I pullulanase [Turicibacter sp.]|nr:type I pullulanase [Turicibacter sp.]